MPEEPTAADPTEDDIEIEVLSPDEIFRARLTELLTTFSLRQSEILRLAEYMDERSTEIDNAARRARELISAQLDTSDEVNDDAIATLMTAFEQLQADSDLSEEDRRDAFVTALRAVSKELPKGVVSTYLESVLRAMNAPPGVSVLRSSLLVTLVGELEMLVNYLARACVERQPSALDDGGRSYTWAQISRYESIDEMRDAVVDRTIEDVLRGSLKEWVEYFIKRFKVPEVQPAKTMDAQEIIQRRHCIVHNGGMVSSQYLDKLADLGVRGEVGDELDVDSEYLRNAADTLYLVAYSLVWSLGFKLCTNDEDRDDLTTLFANRTYFLLQEHRYALVKRIGQAVPLHAIDEDAGFVIRVNYWLAHKLSGEFEKVRGEVEALKVASKSRRFNLAKHALLDEHEDAHRVAESMIRDDELRLEYMFTWPLLAGVREHIRKKSEENPVASDAEAD